MENSDGNKVGNGGNITFRKEPHSLSLSLVGNGGNITFRKEPHPLSLFQHSKHGLSWFTYSFDEERKREKRIASSITFSCPLTIGFFFFFV